jgi:hypothetical protein
MFGRRKRTNYHEILEMTAALNTTEKVNLLHFAIARLHDEDRLLRELFEDFFKLTGKEYIEED